MKNYKINKILRSKTIPDDPYLFESMYPEVHDFIVRCYFNLLTESYDYEMIELLDEGVMRSLQKFGESHPKIAAAAAKTAKVAKTAAGAVGAATGVGLHLGIRGGSAVAKGATHALGGVINGAAEALPAGRIKNGVRMVGNATKALGTTLDKSRHSMRGNVDRAAEQQQLRINHFLTRDDPERAKLERRILDRTVTDKKNDDPTAFRRLLNPKWYDQNKAELQKDLQTYKDKYHENPKFTDLNIYGDVNNTEYGRYEPSRS